MLGGCIRAFVVLSLLTHAYTQQQDLQYTLQVTYNFLEPAAYLNAIANGTEIRNETQAAITNAFQMENIVQSIGLQTLPNAREILCTVKLAIPAGTLTVVQGNNIANALASNPAQYWDQAWIASSGITGVSIVVVSEPTVQPPPPPPNPPNPPPPQPPNPPPPAPPPPAPPPPNPPPSPPPPSPHPPPPPPTPVPLDSSESDSHGLSNNTIIAIAAGGGGGAVCLLALVAAYLFFRKPTGSQPGPTFDDGASSTNNIGPPKDGHAAAVIRLNTANDPGGQYKRLPGHSPVAGEPSKMWPMVPEIEGLLPGDPFTRSTAPQYTWREAGASSRMVNIEAGVNDVQLDRLLRGSANKPEFCPVVQLSHAEVVRQLELQPSGLLGKGATAMVFKARWPSRFGDHALLAVKVLKDAYDAHHVIMDSFSYEAGVLSSLRHPNIVRIYGYCLELPTVCLIMELLPGTLKDRLNPEPRRVGPMPVHQPSVHTYIGTHVSNAGNGDTQLSGYSVANSTNMLGTEHSAYSDTHMSNGRADIRQRPSDPTPNAPPRGNQAPAQKLMLPGSNAGNVRVEPMTMLEVLQISADIAAGLAYLHEKPISAELMNQTVTEIFGISEHDEASPEQQAQKGKVVHRDLKPGNILLDSRGRAKITDFGLARQHHSTTIQTVHLGAGTLPYMAPELLVGRHAGPYAQYATNKVDIYSMAMLMWQMVSGHMPWTGMTEVEILAAVTSGRRPVMPNSTDGNEAGTPGHAAIPHASKRRFNDGPLPFEVDIAHIPASFDLLPQFNQILAACWQQREYKRPAAVMVYQALVELLMQCGYDTNGKPCLQNVPPSPLRGRGSSASTSTGRFGAAIGQQYSQNIRPPYHGM